MDEDRSSPPIRRDPGGDPVLRIRSALRFQSLGERTALFGFGVALPAFLFASLVLSLSFEGSDPSEWSAWLGVLLGGSVLVVAAIGDILPATLTLDDRAVELRDLWKVKRIPLANVRSVRASADGRRLVITVESVTGTRVTADAFDEGEKQRLLDRLRRLPMVRRPVSTREVRPRGATYATSIVGLTLLGAGLAAIAVVTAAKGYPEVAMAVTFFGSGIVLMILGGMSKTESLRDAGMIPLGLGAMFWGAYAPVASALGASRVIAPPSPWLGLFLFAFGAGVVAFGGREMGRSRARERSPPPQPG